MTSNANHIAAEASQTELGPDAALIQQIISAESSDDRLQKLIARYLKRGMDADHVIAKVHCSMAAAKDGSDKWKSRIAQIPLLVKGAGKYKDEDVGDLPVGSEQALAEILAESAAGVLRWSPGFDWMANQGTHWERDDLLRRYTEAKGVCRNAAKVAGKQAAKICALSAVTNPDGLWCRGGQDA